MGTEIVKVAIQNKIRFDQPPEATVEVVHLFKSSTHTSFYTAKLLHTNGFAKMLSHTEAFVHRTFDIPRSFYTQNPLHTEASTHRRLTQRCFYTQGFYTLALLLRDSFPYRCFYNQTISDIVTHRRIYTQKLYTQKVEHIYSSFYTQAPLHKHAFTHRGFCTQNLLHPQKL